MPWEEVNKVELGGALTLSGLFIVFAALVILILAVVIMGKVLGVRPKAKPQQSVPTTPAVAAAPVPVPAAPAAPAAAQAAMEDAAIAAISAAVACATQPADEDDDTVAAISAAVACIMEETAPGIEYAITSIRRSADVRPVWGFAGMQQNTRPF